MKFRCWDCAREELIRSELDLIVIDERTMSSGERLFKCARCGSFRFYVIDTEPASREPTPTAGESHGGAKIPRLDAPRTGKVE
jgi:hypothetical protein